MYENTKINITGNRIGRYVILVRDWDLSGRYPYCFFQYQTSQNNHQIKQANYSIFIDNVYNPSAVDVRTVHCAWLDEAVFRSDMPYIVNSRIITVKNKEGQQMMLQETKKLCYCTNGIDYNCSIDVLGPVFPGQTLSIKLAYRWSARRADNKSFPISVVSQNISNHECAVLQSKEAIQKVESRQCTTVNFTILSSHDYVCELFIMTHEAVHDLPATYDAYFIRLHACPVGFILYQKQCTCDLVLTNSPLSIKSCNIDHQSLLRPDNSWIFGNDYTMNNSHKYLISSHCPFDYCLPYSSYLNLSSPDLQCQFNRTGLLCGKCRSGLSAVFGSSQCQQCSNIYLLIIIPLAITGVVLVFMLFFLNLTVTDGDIVPFIFYANIVNINSAVFFSQGSFNHPAYIFISIANLNLGINTCFYDGMDDYAKMWLTLIFPLYLILLVLTLTKISSYSTKLQLLTAYRSTHVMATVLLLSYTKLLIAASHIIFFYTKLIHLPGYHSTVVWSVDANVELFGIKFTCLFVAYLILFLVITASIVIMLMKKSSLPAIISLHILPLLNAFRAPYKDRFYYWTGLQLLLRAIFFALSTADKKINLTVGIILLVALGYIRGQLVIFKSNYKNYSEILYLLNLVVLFSFHNGIILTNVVTIMIGISAIQFTMTVLYHVVVFSFHGKINQALKIYWQPFINKVLKATKRIA